MNRSIKRNQQTGAVLVEYAIASLIFIVTLLWVGYALEDTAIGARDSSLQTVSGSQRVAVSAGTSASDWGPAGMVPCGAAIVAPEDCF